MNCKTCDVKIPCQIFFDAIIWHNLRRTRAWQQTIVNIMGGDHPVYNEMVKLTRSNKAMKMAYKQAQKKRLDRINNIT